MNQSDKSWNGTSSAQGKNILAGIKMAMDMFDVISFLYHSRFVYIYTNLSLVLQSK